MTTLTAVTETCYAHDGWPFPVLFPLLFLALLLLWSRPWRRRHGHGGGEHVLAERYARGEIDEAEYRARRQVLRHR